MDDYFFTLSDVYLSKQSPDEIFFLSSSLFWTIGGDLMSIIHPMEEWLSFVVAFGKYRFPVIDHNKLIPKTNQQKMYSSCFVIRDSCF